MKTIALAVLVLASSIGLANAQEVPSGYPSEYQQIIDAAKAEGEVVIYSNMSAKQWQPFLNLAATRYPWLSIQVTDSGDDMWEKYYAESGSGATTADLMLTNSVDRWPVFVERGQVDAYVSAEAAALPEWSVPFPGVYTVSADPTVFVYNKALIEQYGGIPKSRADILKLAKAHPELKGRIATIDPTGGGLALGAFWTLTEARPETWALLEEIGPYLRPERSSGTVREKVTSGEYVLALLSSGAGIPDYELPEAKPIVGYGFPSDGEPISMRNVAVTKAASHPNAARVVLDLLLSKQGSLALAEQGQFPYRDDIGEAEAPYVTYASLRALIGEENLILIKPDAALAKKREAFIARWQTALGR